MDNKEKELTSPPVRFMPSGVMMTYRQHALVCDLLEQMMEKATLDDRKHQMNMLSEYKASHAIGESWMIYHLKALKELIKGGNV